MKIVETAHPVKCFYYSEHHPGKKIKVIHEPTVLPILCDMIKLHEIEWIIELGTHSGGLALVLHENTNTKIITFDNKICKNKHLFGPKVSFQTADILSKKNEFLIKCCQNKRHKKLLYCDNGNKAKEVYWYAPYLNPGDLLGIHDWGSEIYFNDVKNTLKDFTPENHDLFETNQWLTRFWIKKHGS